MQRYGGRRFYAYGNFHVSAAAIAVMYLNTNKTAVAYADTVLRASINFYWNHNNSRSYGSSFMCILVRAYALFNRRSLHLSTARMSDQTDGAFHTFFMGANSARASEDALLS